MQCDLERSKECHCAQCGYLLPQRNSCDGHTRRATKWHANPFLVDQPCTMCTLFQAPGALAADTKEDRHFSLGVRNCDSPFSNNVVMERTSGGGVAWKRTSLPKRIPQRQIHSRSAYRRGRAPPHDIVTCLQRALGEERTETKHIQRTLKKVM